MASLSICGNYQDQDDANNIFDWWLVAVLIIEPGSASTLEAWRSRWHSHKMMTKYVTFNFWNSRWLLSAFENMSARMFVVGTRTRFLEHFYWGLQVRKKILFELALTSNSIIFEYEHWALCRLGSNLVENKLISSFKLFSPEKDSRNKSLRNSLALKTISIDSLPKRYSVMWSMAFLDIFD